MADTQLPGSFVAADAVDVGGPAAELLKLWQLLPTAGADQVGALRGTPDSVAVIKTGMSAAAKWWSTAGVGAATLTALLAQFEALPKILQRSVGIGLPVFTSAVVLGIAYIVANDVRGRADATQEQLRSRAAVLQAYLALLATTRAAAASGAGQAAGAASGKTAAPSSDELDAWSRALVVAVASTGSEQLTGNGDGSTGVLGALRQLDGRPPQVQVGDDWVDLADVIDFHP
ncbi:hypothetical protein [Angustibacter sp. Root456]|uniref:hypothetical protein n=1 Tax=Angustibacter sp. Root456 TaxID=1736539 RepID=UPI0006F32565|nr:hypothetical protein [Angustibacter sp. Root456]KQX68834.1 hypothetical protein ASD06_17215 [Angustibacter sp. Root456]